MVFKKNFFGKSFLKKLILQSVSGCSLVHAGIRYFRFNLSEKKWKISLLIAFINLICFSSCNDPELSNPLDAGAGALAAPYDAQISTFAETTAVLYWQEKNTVPNGTKIEALLEAKLKSSEEYKLLGKAEPNGGTAAITGVFLPDTNYYCRLKVSYGGKESGYTENTMVGKWNLSPVNVQAELLSDTAVSLTWSASGNAAQGYIIEKGEDGQNFVEVDRVAANVTQFTHGNGMSAGKTYYYRISGYTGRQKSVSVQKNVQVVFNAPSNVTVQLPTDTAAIVQWQDNSTIETGFDLYMSVDGGQETYLKTVPANTTQTSWEGDYLVGHTYVFGVSARSKNNVTAITRTTASSIVFSAPSNVTVQLPTDTVAVIEWQDNSTIESGFDVYMNVDGGPETYLKTVPANTTQTSWEGDFFMGHTYAFSVRANSSRKGTTAFGSASAQFSIMQVTNLQVIIPINTTANLSWTNGNGYAREIVVEQSNDGTSYALLKTMTSNATSTTVVGSYSNGSIYYFRIQSKTKNNVGSYISSYLSAGGIEMHTIPGGTFQMGDNSADVSYDEKPVHSVTLSSFKMSKTEITQKQWREVMGSSPSYFSGDNLPVERVSWFEAIDFCNKLSVIAGKTPCYSINENTNPTSWTSGTIVMEKNGGYRLPTEAEWEYAAREGGQVIKYAGTNNVNDLGNYAWYSNNSNSITHQVATKTSNALGLYDMCGNVWEWCWDRLGTYSGTAQTNPTGAIDGSYRVLRGGSRFSHYGDCRMSNRTIDGYPNGRSSDIGFRVVQD